MPEKAKILIVDDAKDLSDAIGDILKFKGYQTIVAHDGASAITIALEEHPDLILLDLRMPGLTGFDVIRKLREDDWGKTVKILMLTAVDRVDDIPADLAIKPEDYLMKSRWGIDNIAQRIEKKLSE
jgi:DNA-binding response OmpR family regulator